MSRIKKEVNIICAAILIFFVIFLFFPLIALVFNSFKVDGLLSVDNYLEVMKNKTVFEAILNSFKVSSIAAWITTILAFLIAYTVNFTNIIKPLKKFLIFGVSLPMLLPSITYGFAIIFTLGKKGIVTRLLGKELFEIYGMYGIILGFVIYTLPVTFLLINNTFTYLDKKMIIVSKLMGDSSFKTFCNTIIKPMVGTLAGAFILSFILSLTDFGIPASIGGTYKVIPIYLYEVMLGSIPDLNKGSVIAILMLIPSIIGFLLLKYFDRFKYYSNKATNSEILSNKTRDMILTIISMLIVLSVLSIFAVIFIAPFVKNYPYNLTFTFKYVKEVLATPGLFATFRNSLLVATVTGIIGTMIAYFSAVINVRTNVPEVIRMFIDLIASLTNTIPGMVLGLSFLLTFNGTSIKKTFIILIISNMIHFFTTPYFLAKNSLVKLSPSYEMTGELLGDTWFKTISRVIIPSTWRTMVDMFYYFFVNAMVTISAIIFLVSARTMLVTTKIQQLQHFGDYSKIFVLSIMIILTNLIVKIICDNLSEEKN